MPWKFCHITEVFSKKGVLRKFAKLTGKHPHPHPLGDCFCESKLNAHYITQVILLFIFSCCKLYVWLTDGRWSKLNRLTNSVCFRVRSITKKRNMESTVWKYKVESVVHVTWKQHGNTGYSCWCQNKLIYEIVLLVHIYTLLHS